MKNRITRASCLASLCLAPLAAFHLASTTAGQTPVALPLAAPDFDLVVEAVPEAPGTWKAANRRGNMRAVFTPRGLRVADPAGRRDDFWLRLERWGRGAVLQDVEAAAGTAKGTCVEFRRGALTEWYVNDARGVFVYGIQAEASATHRNAGLNADSYAVLSPPVLGAAYQCTIDVGGTTGHGFAWLVGYAGPMSLALGGGRMLLVNVTAPGGELLGVAAKAGPLVSYDLPVPLDAALLGFEVSTQALHFGGGAQPFALSNAQDLFFGE